MRGSVQVAAWGTTATGVCPEGTCTCMIDTPTQGAFPSVGRCLPTRPLPVWPPSLASEPLPWKHSMSNVLVLYCVLNVEIALGSQFPVILLIGDILLPGISTTFLKNVNILSGQLDGYIWIFVY